MFDWELLTNKAMTEQAAAFNPPHPEPVGDVLAGQAVRTGALVRQDGSVQFRVLAPAARSAEVWLTAFPDARVALRRDQEGMFEGVLPYEERLRGPQDIRILLDGLEFLHPYIPAHYRSFRLVNFVEIPDAESEMIMLRDVPHGQVVREVYFSAAMNAWERALVYLPPHYRDGGEFPVLYLQHGATENENEWVYMGKMPYILDNLLAEGKCVPFIAVMNDGMERGAEEGIMDFRTFGRMLIEDCMPFIERNYRTLPGKENRAMAGLSLGSMQTCVFGLSHPELFAYLGLFSGFMRGGLGGDVDFAAWPHLERVAREPDFLRDNYRLFFRSIGARDRFFHAFEEDSAACGVLGLDRFANYAARVYPDMTHDWGAFRRGFRDFAQMIFW